jgi:hypothetical protein
MSLLAGAHPCEEYLEILYYLRDAGVDDKRELYDLAGGVDGQASRS